jgi:hypothetical protein
VRHAREQILQAQQGANLFIQRKFVVDHAAIVRCAVEEESRISSERYIEYPVIVNCCFA